MTGPALPGICVVCRTPVRWSSGAWRQLGSRGHVHRCPETCGVWMPIAKERCARRAGHTGSSRDGYGHRTRYALDNNARMNSGRGLARVVA